MFSLGQGNNFHTFSTSRGIKDGLETVDCCLRRSPFPGLTESREPDGFFWWPRNQSLFVSLCHYMPTVNEIAIQNKLSKILKIHSS